MGTIGTSQKQREALEKTKNIFEDVHELTKGDNVFRVIQGPQKNNVVFYPTVIEVEEDGEKKIKPTFRAANFLEVPQLIHSIQSAESSVRTQLGDTKGELGFKVQTRWWYLAIDTLDKTETKVKPVKFPKGVKDDITDIETKLDIQDPEYLMEGMYYLYDILIEKTVDPKVSKRYGTKYKTSIYGNNTFKARIPAEFLKLDASEVITELGGMEAVFKPEYIQAIEDNEIVLEDVLIPMNDIQVKELLQKFPINLLGRRAQDGALTFPQSPAFAEMLEALGLPTVSMSFGEDGEPVVSSKAGQSGIKTKLPNEQEEEPAATTEEKEEEPTSQEEKFQVEIKSKIKELPKIKDANPAPEAKIKSKIKTGSKLKDTEKKHGDKW